MLMPSQSIDFENPRQTFPWYPNLLGVIEDRQKNMFDRWASMRSQHEMQLASMKNHIQRLRDLDEFFKASVSCSESGLTSIAFLDSLAAPMLSHLAIDRMHRLGAGGYNDFAVEDLQRQELLLSLQKDIQSSNAHCASTMEATIAEYGKPTPPNLPAVTSDNQNDMSFLAQLYGQLKSLTDDLGTRIATHNGRVTEEFDTLSQLRKLKKELEQLRQFTTKAKVSVSSDRDLDLQKLKALLLSAETEKENLTRIRQALKERAEPNEMANFEHTINSLIATLSLKIDQQEKSKEETPTATDGPHDDDEPKTIYSGGHAIPSWIAKQKSNP